MISLSITLASLLWTQSGSEIELFSSDPRLTEHDRAALREAKRWLDSGPVGGVDGSVTYTYGERTPTLICSVLHVCSLDLQVGEEITGLKIGDKVRWLVEIAHSGEGSSKQVSVVFKPTDAALKTNIQIFTSRRKYTLNLLSTRKYFTPTIKFHYPEDPELKLLRLQAEAETQQQEKETRRVEPLGLLLEDIDGNYLIEGDAPWKPTRVYSSNRQTAIVFPEGTQYRGLPVPIIIHQKGTRATQSLANYRVLEKDGTPILVIDALFDQAQLVQGVGAGRQQLTITRKGFSPRQQAKGPLWKR